MIALVAAGCTSEGSAASEELTLEIAEPTQGDDVSSPFRMSFESTVPLDDPSTGEHHVHVCVDGDDCDAEGQYSLVYGDTFLIEGLSPGEHTLEASLRNADHTDAGPTDTVTVTVAESGGSTERSGSTTGGGSTGATGGYDV
jgi:hypothetical protein